MAVDIDDKKLDGKGLSDLWGIIKQYVAQHGSGVVPATEDTLGGIMVGSTLSITNAGVLNLPTLVTASTFRSVSVDAYGRVVGGTNPTTLAGYGITDAKIENGVITLGGNTITPITSLSGYATQSWVQQQGYTTNIGTVTQVKIGSTAYNPSSGVVSLPSYPTVPTKVSELTNDSGYTTNIGTVTQVKVGSTAYNPSSGIVSLPAYPTSLPASDVYSWAKASSKPSYTLDEVNDGGSRKLANYLPLSGGTMSNTNLVTNLNAQYLNGYGAYDGTNNGYVFIGDSNCCEMGVHIEFHYDKTSGLDYSTVLKCTGNHRNIVDLPSTTGTLALTSDNVASATKLQTPRTIWGQSFDGSGNVSGTLSNVYGIKNSGYYFTIDSNDEWVSTIDKAPDGGPIFGYGQGQKSIPVYYTGYGIKINGNGAWGDTSGINITTSNNVGIGTGSPAYKLDVSGDVRATNFRGNLVGNADSSTKLQTARTIWGQSFDGSGNVTGNLELLHDNRLYVRKVNSQPTLHAGFLYDYAGTEAFVFTTGYADARMVFYTSLGLDTYTANDYQTRTPDLCLYDNNVGIGTHSPSYKLHVNGSFNATSGSISGYSIIHAGNIGSQSVSYASSAGSASYATSSGTSASCTGNAASATQLQTSRTIWGQSFNGTGNVSGAMSSVTSVDSLLYFDTTNNRIGINTSAPIDGVHLEKKNVVLRNTSSNDGIWVELKGVSYDWGIATGSGDVNRGIIDFGGAGWMLYFDASNTYCEYGNFVCSGGVTALSDIRHKSIVENTNITVEQIARMRSVKFLWSDGRDDDNIYVGSIAQDWQSILPEVVLRKDDKDGTLSLNYGVAALVSVITTARKVVDHERRIRELENENKRLKQMLNAA